MSYTAKDLKMQYHMNTGHEAGDSEYYDWLEEEVVRLKNEIQSLMDTITKLTIK